MRLATKIVSKWVKLRVLGRQLSSSSRDLPDNDVENIVDVIPDNTVEYNQCMLTLAHETISLLSLLLPEPGWDGEGSTQGATLPATCRTTLSPITEQLSQ
jgi:hypothetical protein